MKSIAAIALSDHLALPPVGSTGGILSIHRDYLNISLMDSVVTFARKGSPKVPFGVIVEIGSEWDFRALNRNHAVMSEDGRIKIGDDVMFTGLTACSRYSCRPTARQQYDDDQILRRLHALHEFCRKSPRNGGILTYLGRYQLDGGTLQRIDMIGAVDERIRRRFEALMTGIVTTNNFLIIEGVHGIMGVGPGLTPSGDDFLVGFLAGLTHCRPERMTQATAVMARCLERDATEFTTSVSAAYMRCAAKGEYHQYVTEFINAFCAGTGENLQTAAERLITLGHYSGTDLLLGFAYGGMIALHAMRKDGSHEDI